MSDSTKSDLNRYENGKQTIVLIMNLFILVGFIMEIVTFHKIYITLQYYLQLFSAAVFTATLILVLVSRKRFYVLSYLILTYYLITNIVVYDIVFPEFIIKLNFLRSEFFSRNLFFLLPFIAIVGFISSKRHIVIQSIILILYIIFQVIWNSDKFIQESAINYILTTIGFCVVIYYLVNSNQIFIRDLNDSNKKLKEAQQHLIQSEKMASLGTLTAGVAHEINNPLNFIQGGVYGLDDYFLETNQDKDKRIVLFMNGIKTGIERVSTIVKGLNHFNRDTSNTNENCDIHSIIDYSLVMLQNRLKDRIEVIKKYTSEPYLVKGNVGRLNQVFLNILTNASQAINDTGTITITTNIISDKIIIEVIDTGCGISRENISKITEPFFTTREPGMGTGLGLSISYTIIQEHKGEMNFKSVEAKGTTVTITLPLI